MLNANFSIENVNNYFRKTKWKRMERSPWKLQLSVVGALRTDCLQDFSVDIEDLKEYL